LGDLLRENEIPTAAQISLLRGDSVGATGIAYPCILPETIDLMDVNPIYFVASTFQGFQHAIDLTINHIE
jgi:hypothetical protein